MNEWESDEKLARAADLPGLDDALRAELLAATSRVVRARRYRRVALQCAAVALAFISGMLTMAQWNPRNPTAPAVNTPTTFTEATPESEPTENNMVPAATPSTPLYADPEALAMAFDKADTQERLRLLRGAGDYELNDRGDVRNALAYYEQWVHLADQNTRTQYDENDTWLLASLKLEE